MAGRSSFQILVLDQLSRAIPGIRSRAMFGGVFAVMAIYLLVNIAFLRVVPPAFQPSGFSFCPYSSAQHIPRLQRSPLRVVYARSENHSQAERGPNCCHVTHDACVPPVLGGSTAGTQAPCVSTWTCTQIPAG